MATVSQLPGPPAPDEESQDIYKQLTARSVLLDPFFHRLPVDQRKYVLGRIAPDFASQPPDVQDATIGVTLDEWKSYFTAPKKKEPEPGLLARASRAMKEFLTLGGPRVPSLEATKPGIPTPEDIAGKQRSAEEEFARTGKITVPKELEAPPLPEAGISAGPPLIKGMLAPLEKPPATEAELAAWAGEKAYGAGKAAARFAMAPLLDTGRKAAEQVEAALAAKTDVPVYTPMGLFRVDPTNKVQAGAYVGVMNLVGSLTSPFALAMGVAGGPVFAALRTLKAPVAVMVQAGFTGQMLSGMIANSKEVLDAYEQRDWQRFTEASVELLGNTVFTVLGTMGLKSEVTAWRKNFQAASAKKPTLEEAGIKPVLPKPPAPPAAPEPPAPGTLAVPTPERPLPGLPPPPGAAPTPPEVRPAPKLPVAGIRFEQRAGPGGKLELVAVREVAAEARPPMEPPPDEPITGNSTIDAIIRETQSRAPSASIDDVIAATQNRFGSALTEPHKTAIASFWNKYVRPSLGETLPRLYENIRLVGQQKTAATLIPQATIDSATDQEVQGMIGAIPEGMDHLYVEGRGVFVFDPNKVKEADLKAARVPKPVAAPAPLAVPPVPGMPPGGALSKEVPKGEPKVKEVARGSEEVYRGSANPDLNDTGLAQAQDIGTSLQAKGGLDELYASDLGRTEQTAWAISQATGAPIIETTPGLHPWHLGPLEGEKVTEKNVQRMKHLIEKEPDAAIDGRAKGSTEDGESFNQFKTRFLTYFQSVLRKFQEDPTKRIGIVTHYRDIKVLQSWIKSGANGQTLEIDPKEMYKKDGDPGSVYHVAPTAQGLVMTRVALRDPAETNKPGIYVIRHGMTDWNEGKTEAKPLEKPPEAKPSALPKWIGDNARQALNSLTYRTREALQDLAAQELTAKQIAEMLGIDEETVRLSRVALGIPGIGNIRGVEIPEERAEFERWRTQYLASKLPKPPSEEVAKAEAAPERALFKRGSLGVPVSEDRMDNSWVTPDGVIYNVRADHWTSLAEATGLDRFFVAKNFAKLAADNRLMRTHFHEDPPRSGFFRIAAEVFTEPTRPQIGVLREMEKLAETEILYDVREPKSNQVVATGRGMRYLMRDVETHLGAVAKAERAPEWTEVTEPPTKPVGARELSPTERDEVWRLTKQIEDLQKKVADAWTPPKGGREFWLLTDQIWSIKHQIDGIYASPYPEERISPEVEAALYAGIEKEAVGIPERALEVPLEPPPVKLSLEEEFYLQKFVDEGAPRPEGIERAGAEIPRTLAISTKPAEMEAFKEPLAGLVEKHQRIVEASGYDPGTGDISWLNDLGEALGIKAPPDTTEVMYVVTQPTGFGTWAGPEPNFRLRFARWVPLDFVHQVASILGEGWRQGSVGVSHPESTVHTFAGLVLRKPDRSAFTIDEINRLAREGKVGFETTPDGTSILFNKYWPGRDTFVRDTIESIKSLGLTEDDLRTYTGDSHLVERGTGDYRRNLEEIRDKTAAAGRPDLLDGIISQLRAATDAEHPAYARAVAELERRDDEALSGARLAEVEQVGGEPERRAYAERPETLAAPDYLEAGVRGRRGLERPVPERPEGAPGLPGALAGPGGREPGVIAPEPTQLGLPGLTAPPLPVRHIRRRPVRGITDPMLAAWAKMLEPPPKTLPKLRPGQTKEGKEVGEFLSSLPAFRPASKLLRVNEHDRRNIWNFATKVIEDPVFVRGYAALEKEFDYLREECAKAESDPEISQGFRNSDFAGPELSPDINGVNFDGIKMYGEGGRSQIFINLLAAVDKGFILVDQGVIKTEELATQMSRALAETMLHEIAHTATRHLTHMPGFIEKFEGELLRRGGKPYEEALEASMYGTAISRKHIAAQLKYMGPFEDFLERTLRKHQKTLDTVTEHLKEFFGANEQQTIKDLLGSVKEWQEEYYKIFPRIHWPKIPENLVKAEKEPAAELPKPPRYISTRLLEKPLEIEAERPSVVDVGRALSEYTGKHYGVLKAPVGHAAISAERESAMRKRFLEQAGTEIAYQIARDSSMMNWYLEDIQRTMDLSAQIRPSLSDPNQQKVFSALLAILSPRTPVPVNYEAAIQAYDMWLETGKIPAYNPDSASGSWGPLSAAAYSNNLKTLQVLLDLHNGDIQATFDWLMSEHPVSEIKKYKVSVRKLGPRVEGKPTDMRLGSYIFGEKIGAYLANMNGVLSELTADSWFCRAWNRIMGTVEIQQVYNRDLDSYQWVMQEAPRNNQERRIMKESVGELARILKIPASSVQAVWWYYEQSLYAAHGVDSKPYSYADAAEKYLSQRGVTYEPRKVLQPPGKVPASYRDASEPGPYAFRGRIPGRAKPSPGEIPEGLEPPPEQAVDISFPFGELELSPYFQPRNRAQARRLRDTRTNRNREIAIYRMLGREGMGREVVQAITDLQSGLGNFVLIEDLRKAVPGATDEVLTSMAREGKLVLGGYDGPRPVSHPENYVQSGDNLYSAVAISREEPTIGILASKQQEEKILSTAKYPQGLCFRNALSWARENDAGNPIIVHGKVTSATGTRFDHAWVEVGGNVVDPTADVTVNREIYYQIADATPEARYTIEQALVNMVRARNDGPWTTEEVGGRKLAEPEEAIPGAGLPPPPEVPGGPPGGAPPTPPEGPPPAEEERRLPYVSVTPRPKGWTEAFRVILAPGTRGPEAKIASGSIRQRLAERDLMSLRASHRLAEQVEYFRWRPNEENLEFIDAMESGAQIPEPGEPGGIPARISFRVASKFKKGLDSVDARAFDQWAFEITAQLAERVQRVRALGTGKLQNLVENYFPHMWKDPAAASAYYARYYGHAPFEGPKSFLMRRTIPTTAEGIAAGLEPITYNPTELVLLKLREIDRYVAAHQVLQDLDNNGLIATISAGARPPVGYEVIDDRIGMKYTKVGPRRFALVARTAAPEPVVRLLNNYLQPGLRGWKPYDAIRWTGNLLNMVQLGLSGFHLTFTAGDAAVSAASVAVMRLSHGDLAGAATAFAKLPIAPFKAFAEGRKIFNQAMSGNFESQEMATIIDMAQKGGAGFKMDSFYDTGVLGSFLRDLSQNKSLSAAAKVPALLIETAARPVLDYVVPRMKLGVMADMIRYELEKLGGRPASEIELREVMGKVVDSVDNRMGQLRYDNLHWNRTLKDLLMASIRSVGWNLGTFREFGGAVGDTVAAAKQVARGEIPELTHRQAYAIMAPIVVGLVGAVYQVLHTGEWPDEFKDYYFPKTGRVLSNGDPERVALPSYMKDMYAYLSGFQFGLEPGVRKFGITVSHKLHPLLNAVSDLVIRNEDYYGNQIRGDTLWEQLSGASEYIMKLFLPFSLRNLEQRRKTALPRPPGEKGPLEEPPGYGLALDIESFFGAVPAPSTVSKTRAEEVLDKILMERMPRRTRTEMEKNRREAVLDLLQKYRTGGEASAREAIGQNPYLRQRDLRAVERRSGLSHLTYGIQRVGIEDALQVYESADEDERTELLPIIRRKLTVVRGRSPAEREAIRAKLDRLGIPFPGSESEPLEPPP